MAARKRRGPKYPGVVLIKPNKARRSGWQARYKSPDTGKTKHETLPAELTTLEQREQWAVGKSRELVERRMELEKGAPRATGGKLAEAIKRYFSAHPQLRPRTVEAYEAATAKLSVWADGVGLRSADDLTRAKLMAFRETLIRQPKNSAVKGGKRGEQTPLRELRSPERVNSELRKVRTVLGYLVDADLFPRLTRDDLRRALKRLPVTHERIEYMRAPELQKLLEAALVHDAEMFAETRDEHVGARPVGSTARYEPIAPFVSFVLLTGCRLGEALALEWTQTDLDALDHEGRKVGEIHLTGAATKTHKARTVGLEVSPALRDMLTIMQKAARGKGSVFGLSRGTAEAAAKRLRADYGAPKSFTWQALRRTCGTYLTNAGGIFGAASAYRSAKQLGHSVQVAERHYTGLVRGIPASARTLEAAMQIEEVMGRVLSPAEQQEPVGRQLEKVSARL
ncbi:MAG: Phage integrase family [Pseudomonadota bacterium]|jgi:integrase